MYHTRVGTCNIFSWFSAVINWKSILFFNQISNQVIILKWFNIYNVNNVISKESMSYIFNPTLFLINVKVPFSGYRFLVDPQCPSVKYVWTRGCEFFKRLIEPCWVVTFSVTKRSKARRTRRSFTLLSVGRVQVRTCRRAHFLCLSNVQTGKT